MFLSMTGFGRAARSFPWGTVTLEIISVNHRYQEVSVRLPKELSSFESKIVSSLRTALKRGKIRLNAEINWAPEYRTVRLDGDVLGSYYAQMQEISVRLGASPVFDLTSLLALPGVCDSQRAGGESDEEFDEAWDALLAATTGALADMKRSEGGKLEEFVDQDLWEFERLVNTLSERWSTASSSAFEGLSTRIQKIMERFNLEIDQGRIAQEVSILADKWDVAEELARLVGHISKFKEIMSGVESEGRKLDFLIQEMNREINTMGSKVGDAEFRWTIVEAKSCLERIREQIQNVE